MSKQERQETLARDHYFECKCMACLDEWTIETMPTAQVYMNQILFSTFNM